MLTREVLTSAIQQAREGVVLASVEGDGAEPTLVLANEAFSALTGYPADAVVGRGPEWLAVLTRDRPAVARIRNAIRQDQPFEGELVLIRRDGSELPVEVIVRPLRTGTEATSHWLLLVRDLLDRKRLEQQLWQTQKIGAISQLAGGVAHEFNNTLLAIAGYTNLLLEGIPEGDPRRGDALAVERAATRAARLIHQLLAFSLPRPLQARTVDLNDVVRELQQLLERVIGEGIRLVVDLAPDLGTVYADYSQIQQVLVNLVVNARDAMPLGGTLTISTANTYPESMLPGSYVGRGAGAQVLLTVSDTGVGMSGDTKARLFEPFFTTKDPGYSPGLGLATVHGIVKQCGGYVWVQSAEGEGTSVRVYLPYEREPSAGSASSSIVPAEVSQVRGGTESVVLVEDDPSVLLLARRVLQRFGYRVHAASNATEAQALIAALPSAPDLLVTDVVLPGVAGPVLANRLRERHPGLRVLYISGYTQDTAPGPHLEPGSAVLPKPFSPEEFAARVREMLDAPPPADGDGPRRPV